MKRLAPIAARAAVGGTYRFQHGPDNRDELASCPPRALPEVSVDIVC